MKILILLASAVALSLSFAASAFAYDGIVVMPETVAGTRLAELSTPNVYYVSNPYGSDYLVTPSREFLGK